MNKTTAIEQAMKEAGVDTDAARLYRTAADHLREAGTDPGKALGDFVVAVRADGGLCAALVPGELIRAEAERYLQRVASDMTATPAGGDQQVSEAQPPRAPAAPAPDGGEAGQTTDDAQASHAPSSPASRDGAGHAGSDDHSGSAPPSDRDGAGQHCRDNHMPSARPARDPRRQPKRSPARSAAVTRQLTEKYGWLGTANVPGGPNYADLRVRDLPGMIERQLTEGGTHARAAVALKVIQKEIERAGVVPPDARWIEVLPENTVQAISRATEIDALKDMAVGWLRSFAQSGQNVLEDLGHAER